MPSWRIQTLSILSINFYNIIHWIIGIGQRKMRHER